MRRSLRTALVGAITVVAVVAGALAGWSEWDKRSDAIVTVDLKQRFQTIDGWEVYPRYWQTDKKKDRFDRSFEPIVDAVSKALVNEVGINRVRIEVWSGLENPTDYWKSHFEGQTGYREYPKRTSEDFEGAGTAASPVPAFGTAGVSFRPCC